MATPGQPNLPQPRLVYTLLPPYDVPDLIVMGGILVENRGGAPANDIRVILEYGDTSADKIRHLQVIGDVEYILQSGGEQQSSAALRVRRLGAGQKMVIYFSGPGHIQPHVRVTYRQA